MKKSSKSSKKPKTLKTLKVKILNKKKKVKAKMISNKKSVKKKSQMKISPLPFTALHPNEKYNILDFETTDEIQDLTNFVGQKRAIEAVSFGVGIEACGHNLYAMGPSGIGKRSIIQSILATEVIKKPLPLDWCYVNNFLDPKKPIALELPTGEGIVLKNNMQNLINELSHSIPVLFDSEDYKNRIKKIVDVFNEQQDKIVKEIEEKAKSSGLMIFFYPQNFVVFALDENGEIIIEEKFAKLSKEEREKKQMLINDFTNQVPDFLKKIPELITARRDKEKEIQKEFSLLVVGFQINLLKEKYKALPNVINYLEAVQEDIIENVKDFQKKDPDAMPLAQFGITEKQTFVRYSVNVMVDNSQSEFAPVIYEENPTYSNLICRVEHVAQFGALTTDFTLIRPGSLHKANGGYLIIDVAKMLRNPFAWVGIKHSLLSRKVWIEPPERLFGLLSTISLEPEPIPLNIKVVLLGDRDIFHALTEYDDDFADLFKVVVDFDERIERKDENIKIYAQLIATLARKNNLKPFNRDAVYAIIDHGMRLSDDAEKLSILMRNIDDLIRESNYYAEQANNPIVDKHNVKKAIDSKIYRLGRLREIIQEEILRNILMIQTEGEVVGQINALSYIQWTRFSFGFPTRITARVRLGEGRIIDIQREVHLGGPIHSKGVLILSGFLASRYTYDRPFSLTATLVFEQTYGYVEGDSASLAELCSLLSAIAEIPIKQSIGITGSVNQYGFSQPIGGVNEKIEGFFDICKKRGLTGDQGVIIPKANTINLILREDVVKACKDKKFNIYSVENVDEAMNILTGVEAGERDKHHKFPKNSINERVEKHIREFAKRRIKPINSLKRGKI